VQNVGNKRVDFEFAARVETTEEDIAVRGAC
jgi:hypothetical protein